MSALPVRLAVQTLRANLLRTVLSTLGIVMGAASLSAVLALGDGAEAFARRRIEGEGLLSILLSAKTFDRIDGVRVPRTTPVQFTTSDLGALAETLGPGAGVTLRAQGRAPLADAGRSGGRPRRRPSTRRWPTGSAVAGTVAPIVVQAGRPLAAADLAGEAPVAVRVGAGGRAGRGRAGGGRRAGPRRRRRGACASSACCPSAPAATSPS